MASTSASTKQTEALIPRCRGTTQDDNRAKAVRPRRPSTSAISGGSQAGSKVAQQGARLHPTRQVPAGAHG